MRIALALPANVFAAGFLAYRSFSAAVESRLISAAVSAAAELVEAKAMRRMRPITRMGAGMDDSLGTR
jgi:hypothetical protein